MTSSNINSTPETGAGEAVLTKVNDTPTQMDRRRFLELAALGSAAIATCPIYGRQPYIDKETGRIARTAYGALHPLAPGAVNPRGWLEVYLQKQARQLGEHLPNVSWPFTGKYWTGEEQPPDKGVWDPWEQKAYWIDGALRCALALRDEKLAQGALSAVEYTLSHPLPDGYLGPHFAKDAKAANPQTSNFRWPHTVFFRALAAHGESTGNRQIAEAMQRHFLADAGRIDYGGPSRDVTNIEGMVWAYHRTGDRRLLDMAEEAWSGFLRSAPPGDRESGDLHPDRVFANTPIHAHGVTYAEKSKLPAILYMHTGKEAYLNFALAAQERVLTHHMLIDGIPSTAEDYRQTTSLDAHETCDISDHTWSWGYLLMATGEGQWADRIERACFNAGLGAIRKDWTGVQYFSCPNQLIATHNSSHVPFVEKSVSWMAYRPNPGHDVACCGGNVHRFLPNYVIRMWMADSDKGMAAVLYGASRVRGEVGKRRVPIEISQETDYPFEEEIRFTIGCAEAVAFPLSLRIPGWCKEPRLLFNGDPLKLPPVIKGFVRLERTFRPGDRITLALPMRPVLTFWPGDGFGLERGPLVYGLPVKETWKPVVVEQWSTTRFPEWEATPAVDWNYGIAVRDTQVVSQTQFEQGAMTADPWVESPVRLTVPMKKIPGWTLTSDPNHPERMQTPPLPRLTQECLNALDKSSTERVALVPYGATHLRLTIFPKAMPFWET